MVVDRSMWDDAMKVAGIEFVLTNIAIVLKIIMRYEFGT